MINSILYFGRKNCEYSDNLKTFLSKKSKKFYYIESKKMYEKLPNKNFLKKMYELKTKYSAENNLAV